MKICFFGIYDPTYSRNDILISGLKSAGGEVIECQADWRDKNRYKILYKKLQSIKNECDVIYAAYPAPVPAIFAKMFTRKPVVMDALYPMFDAVVNDRKEIPWFYPRAIKLWLYDWISALVSDCIIVDTNEHGKYWTKLPFIKKSKIKTIYLGFQEKIFFPTLHKRSDTNFLVGFYGVFNPLQGVPKIIETAHLLRNHADIQFRIIGSGRVSPLVDALMDKYNLKNVERVDRVPIEKLKEYCDEADVILGIFGDTEKARRVVPNKVYQGLALKKPVITMDSPAEREIFSDNDIMLVQNNPEALAEAILKLKNNADLREKIAENGYNKVVEKYSSKPLGRELFNLIEVVISQQ
ncbi:MAG: glycosyltransferase [bacterium]